MIDIKQKTNEIFLQFRQLSFDTTK